MVTIYSDLTTQSKKNFEDRFINNDFMTERRRLGKKKFWFGKNARNFETKKYSSFEPVELILQNTFYI